MRHLRNAVVVAGALLASTAMAALAQRTVNTGGGMGDRAMELGVDIASLTAGLEQPKSLSLGIGGQGLVRLAWFINDNMAFEPAIGWSSTAQENATGSSSYAIDFGFLYGLSSMDPGGQPWYVRPSIAISGGSGGTRSFTTLAGAFGMRRMMHGILMRNEIVLARRLESGPFAATTTLQLRHGISLRRQ